MKTSSLIIVLCCSVWIFTGSTCDKATDTALTVHPTQIVVRLSTNNSSTEKAAVTIDGVLEGFVAASAGGEVVKKVTEGHHTISANSSVTSTSWPQAGIDIKAEQTFTYTLGCDKVNLKITSSIACKSKGVAVINIYVRDDNNNANNVTVLPGDAVTISTGSGQNYIKATDQDKGTVLYETTTPFLKCGSTYGVAVTCD